MGATQLDEMALQRVEESRRVYAAHLWHHIPADGAPIGNVALRRKTKTTSADNYLRTRQAMVDAGIIELGRGRGGSVRRAEMFRSEGAAVVAARQSGLELALYDGIVHRLEEMLADEAAHDRNLVVKTGLQGKRDTGGRWSRPDITVVGLRRFRVLAGSSLEVATYEIKTAAGFDIVALHEARAHRRTAHRSYVLVDLESEDEEAKVTSLIPHARDLGVGLVSFLAVEGEWSTWYEPDLSSPDPVLLDEFLAVQLPEDTKAEIRRWHAQSAAPTVD